MKKREVKCDVRRGRKGEVGCEGGGEVECEEIVQGRIDLEGRGRI